MSSHLSFCLSWSDGRRIDSEPTRSLWAWFLKSSILNKPLFRSYSNSSKKRKNVEINLPLAWRLTQQKQRCHSLTWEFISDLSLKKGTMKMLKDGPSRSNLTNVAIVWPNVWKYLTRPRLTRKTLGNNCLKCISRNWKWTWAITSY